MVRQLIRWPLRVESTSGRSCWPSNVNRRGLTLFEALLALIVILVLLSILLHTLLQIEATNLAMSLTERGVP